ncbi:MAG: MBL fold metallo-hydrolase [Clostridia bacterium]|nr:MBL fold metallo-hydrolase [Clostridia bacterium]
MDKSIDKRTKILRWVIGIAIIVSLIIIIIFQKAQTPNDIVKEGTAQIHYIDVGQADATLILTKNNSVLIDTGRADIDDEVINYIKSKNVEVLDYLIITHFDADHFGEAWDVLEKLGARTLVMPRQEISSIEHQDFINKLATKEDQSIIYANDIVGKSLEDLDEIDIKILAPMESYYVDSNNYSVVSLVTFGENKFLFTGDLEDETTICKEYSDAFLKCDAYKVGHHGSKYSSGNELLLKVKPKIAVISCGEGNDNNHPHDQTLERLELIKDIEIYRTDENGTIVITTDGAECTVKTEK